MLAAGLSALWLAMVPPALADDTGTARQIAPAQRVLTLAPHATEMVFAAGGGARIVGTIRYSDHPPAAQLLPRVGDVWQINLESLLALSPDLLVAWLPGPVAPLQPVLSQAGIPVFFTAPATLADIPDDIEKLGALMGTEDAANTTARDLRQRLAALEATYSAREPVSVFVQAGTHPLYTLTDAHIVGDALRLCGARNGFNDVGPVAPMIDIEAVIAAAPQVILVGVATDEAAALAYWEPYAAALPAVQNGHVFTVDADTLYRPGPRLVDAAETVCKRIDEVRQHAAPGR
nr:cobalamin-binding protein [Pseudomonas sp.]